jgi:Fur family transcriptional regulator, peroxide stress response regulator
MNSAATSQRQTKYCQAIEQTLRRLGHATNAELLAGLQTTFPGLSATTVHRATARLATRGTIALAPSTPNGAMHYDANTTPHDHFQCSSCGLLRDTVVKAKIIPILEASIEGCRISGQLTISGTCKQCVRSQLV